jgi:hypothetical protein
MSFLKFLSSQEIPEDDDPVTNLPVSMKFRTSYTDPATGELHRISVRYEYNQRFTDAFENELLRSPMYEDFDYKANVLNEFINKEIKSCSFTMSPIVTGLKFATVSDDGQLQWECYEDPDSALDFVLTTRVPSHIPRINFQHLTEITAWLRIQLLQRNFWE